MRRRPLSDTVTEQRIQKSFESLMKGRTSLVIAHRLATVRNADRIVVIENGRIIEQGTGSELLTCGGEYARLLHTQEAVGTGRTPMVKTVGFPRQF